MSVIFINELGEHITVYPTNAPCNSFDLADLFIDAESLLEVDDTFPPTAELVGNDVMVTVHVKGHQTPVYFTGPVGWWDDDEVSIA